MKFRVFISSVQDEFAEERRRLKQWLTTDLFVSRFVEDVFLFEDVPSRGKPPQDVFLDEVKSSDIYIGLIGSQYYGPAELSTHWAPSKFPSASLCRVSYRTGPGGGQPWQVCAFERAGSGD